MLVSSTLPALCKSARGMVFSAYSSYPTGAGGDPCFLRFFSLWAPGTGCLHLPLNLGLLGAPSCIIPGHFLRSCPWLCQKPFIPHPLTQPFEGASCLQPEPQGMQSPWSLLVLPREPSTVVFRSRPGQEGALTTFILSS